MTKDINIKKLQQVASNLTMALEDIDRGFVYMSQSDAEFLATRLNEYLSGKAKSLDHAFGVKRSRGAPKNGPIYKHTLEMAVKATYRDKSWSELAIETGMEPRTLQRLAVRHEQSVIAYIVKKIANRAGQEDKEEAESKPTIGQ